MLSQLAHWYMVYTKLRGGYRAIKGEGILQDYVHAQMIDHTHFRHLMMEDTKIIYNGNDAKAKNNGSFIDQNSLK